MNLIKKLYEYENGNYTTKIFSDGTKIRETNEDDLVASFPDNMDVKITNWCDMGSICGFCHEASHLKGGHSDIDVILKALSVLPAGVEIAIGGGATQAHPELQRLLIGLRSFGLIPNLTINELHLNDDLIIKLNALQENDLMYGVGLSFRKGYDHTNLYKMAKNKHAVIHLIAGIDDMSEIMGTLQNFKHKKFLVLGYKTFRKGISFKAGNESAVDLSIQDWRKNIKLFVDTVTSLGGVVSFDNLALEQLDVRSILSDDDWEMFYQGEDGIGGNLYIDAVRQEFSFSSRDSRKFKFEGRNVIEMFEHLREEGK